ncbi:hypothetical protein ACIQNI_29835 [Streptomyces sp. NPDC091266]|uniref:hypothetical protein n=1 Tax=Streptomyces sp. NPDC091266 TaxID=3365978 RepID=UPI003802D787
MLGHDITAAAALRAVQGGVTLPERLVESGFGPERSVVQEAVDRAGWARCAGCAYAGAPAGLAAHVRGGGCEGAGRVESGPDGVPVGGVQAAGVAVEELPAAAAPLPAAEDRTGGSGGPGVGDGDAGLVRVEAGVARGLLLPGPDDGLWREVPLPLRQDVMVAAHRLVSPEPAVLREKGNAPVRYALRAADGRRMGGKHWLALLGAPRESFGSARSERARRVFEVLEQVVADFVAPAVAGSPEGVVSAPGSAGAAPEPPEPPEPGRAAESVDGSALVSGAGPGAGAGAAAPKDTVVEGAAAVPGPGEAELQAADDASSEPAASSSTSASASSASSVSVVRVETGAGRGRLLPGADDPVWDEVPLHLRQALRGPAHQLVTPVRGPLKEPEQRRVLSAVRAAQRMRMTGAHWLLLLTAEREAFGSSGSVRAGAFYKVLEQILAEHPLLTRVQDDPAAPEEAEAG